MSQSPRFPITNHLFKPFFRKCLPCMTLLHAKKRREPISAWRNSHWSNYMLLTRREKRQYGTYNNLQACLASSVWLKFPMSLNPPPPPPCDFGMHNIFHLIQWILFLCSIEFHQKLAIKLVKEAHIDLGSLKHVIAYNGHSHGHCL